MKAHDTKCGGGDGRRDGQPLQALKHVARVNGMQLFLLLAEDLTFCLSGGERSG